MIPGRTISTVETQRLSLRIRAFGTGEGPGGAWSPTAPLRSSEFGEDGLLALGLPRCGEGVAGDHANGHLDGSPGVGVGIRLGNPARSGAPGRARRQWFDCAVRNVAQMRSPEMKGYVPRVVRIVLLVDQDERRPCLQLF